MQSGSRILQEALLGFCIGALIKNSSRVAGGGGRTFYSVSSLGTVRG